MNESENNPTPQVGLTEASAERRPAWSTRQIIFLVCVLLATAVLLTYTLTAAVLRRSYTEKLLAQQALLDQNSALYQTAENLQILDEVLERYSYYADTLDEEAMREAVLHAYVQASGDVYARYYTEEEYEALKSANNAQMCGVGVGVVNKSFTADGQEQLGFYVFDIYEGSTAADVIGVGDFIWAIRIDGVMKTVSELGYSQAVSYISGAENTEVTLGIYRPKTNTFFDATLIRKTFESKSVYVSRLENNPSVGIVRITSFDLKTPSQFKRAVNDLRNAGVTSFVFDVRSNPGGDLVSIRAIASYFLERGDLILDKVDRHGEIVQSYCAEPITYEGDSAACNVAESEIGMFRGLRMTVLCNENTASAAEVFTAVMKDYGLASVVGTKTFGKGIMQTIRKIALGDTVGYIKLTTHAYQTRNGSYHGVGITPNETVELSEDAKKESILILPQDRDEQLKTAVQRLLAVNQ